MRHVAPLLCAAILLTACSGSHADPADADPADDDAGGAVESAPTVPTMASSGSGAFPLAVSDDGRYLVGSRDEPFLVTGDAAWSLIVQLTLDEAEEYLDLRRAQGFNTLVVNLIEHQFADDPPRNTNGDAPFIRDGNFSAPNDAYFEHAEQVLELAAERDFLVMLAPAYLGAAGGAEGWFAEMTANGEDVLGAYGRYVGERFARFDNIIWLEGGDYTPADQYLPLVDAVVEGIKSVDGESLHTPSWSHETSGLDVPVDWIDLNTVYTYQPVHLESTEQYLRHRDVPHILFESEYEDEADFTTPWLLRGQAYHALLTGAVGHVYGHGEVWRFAQDWRAALEAPGAASMAHVATLFADLAWQELEPDLDNEVLTGGMGDEDSREFAVAAATPNRDLAILYVPSSASIELDLSAFDGPVQARFFDPSDGSYHNAGGSPLDATAGLTVTMPGANAAGDSDWVMLFEPVDS